MKFAAKLILTAIVVGLVLAGLLVMFAPDVARGIFPED